MKAFSLAVLMSFAIFLPPPARALSVREAMGMIESGNNDCAVGKHGEVSRYQIRPEFWPAPFEPRDDFTAWAVASSLLGSRKDRFARIHGRLPTAFETYVLWNAPGQILRKAPKISPRVRERATRFANLVEKSN